MKGIGVATAAQRSLLPAQRRSQAPESDQIWSDDVFLHYFDEFDVGN
jgi:hypothetical protein